MNKKCYINKNYYYYYCYYYTEDVYMYVCMDDEEMVEMNTVRIITEA